MKYVRNLSKKDDHVLSVSPQSGKEDRPLLGIIVPVEGKKYCIPLTSIGNKEKFKSKKTTIDCICVRDLSEKNENGAFATIGILNLNNMIPVDESVLTPIDIKIHSNDTQNTRRRKILRTKELDWCQKNSDMIKSHAKRLYELVVNYPEKNVRLVNRCCKFDVLEGVLNKWLKNEQQNNDQDKTHSQIENKEPQAPTKKYNKHDSSRERLSLNDRINNLHKSSKSAQSPQKHTSQKQFRTSKPNHNNNDR